MRQATRPGGPIEKLSHRCQGGCEPGRFRAALFRAVAWRGLCWRSVLVTRIFLATSNMSGSYRVRHKAIATVAFCCAARKNAASVSLAVSPLGELQHCSSVAARGAMDRREIRRHQRLHGRALASHRRHRACPSHAGASSACRAVGAGGGDGSAGVVHKYRARNGFMRAFAVGRRLPSQVVARIGHGCARSAGAWPRAAR